ncbi:hypothetical protein OB236_23910 [Paenibacillus sp. WQ 127069]|uniref:Uncharacterized protein n=1 Tax=Paenibacillus baimaensis TaxID=2982185 RepID=A0ABT2UKN0_9BACL|nr:hypothetical protein [Paenibacillus sp. WQ 127069]MCU6795157.1 hypothetical protein [Paenibacillus sp. WQ 127069]
MVDYYSDLTDNQKYNIELFLKQAGSSHLDKMKLSYGINSGRTNEAYQRNVIDALMLNIIPMNVFTNWLSHVNLEGNNHLFVYEPTSNQVFISNSIELLFENVKKKITPIYDINKDSLDEIKIVDICCLSSQQLVFTLAAPSQVHEKNSDTGEFELQKDIYLSYIIMDFEFKHFVLLMHPTVKLVSIMGEVKERDIDKLTYIIMHSFKNQVVRFDYQEPD